MPGGAAKIGFRPISRYIFIGARARTRSHAPCCSTTEGLGWAVKRQQVRWRSARPARIEEDEEDSQFEVQAEERRWAPEAILMGKCRQIDRFRTDVAELDCFAA